MSAFLSFVGLGLLLARQADAAIGPVTDLRITNAVISPDGFNRS
jgi:hypothetical protein